MRRLAYEASDTGLLSPDLAAGIRRVKGAKRLGVRIGNWLTIDQSRTLLGKPSDTSEANAIEWTGAAAITDGTIFRRISRLDKIWGDGITPKAIWQVVKAAAKRADIKNLAPHDLRRTCARLCHLAGGELEQIQSLLGHASVQTIERYLGCKQRLSQAVNDKLGPRHLME